jgi:hypothetical protein
MGDWFGVVIVFGVAVLAFVTKFVIIKCYLSRCRRSGSNHSAWTDVEEGPSLEAFFIGADVGVVRSLGRNKGPPPKFEKALKCSSPVYKLDCGGFDDEPPPSYEEYMRGQAKLFTIASASPSPSSPLTQSVVAVHCNVQAIQSASRNLVPTSESMIASSTAGQGTEPKENNS